MLSETALSTGNYHNPLLALVLGVFGIAFFIYVVVHYTKEYRSHNERNTPLEIVFDKGNWDDKFWSMELAKDNNGVVKLPLSSYWEYRVAIRNNSTKTARNASVTTQWINKVRGLPRDAPINREFIRTKSKILDLQPGCEEFVCVHFWPEPAIQAGMLAGQSIPGYGQLKIVASGDDILPAKRYFKLNYELTPMLIDMVAPPDD